MTQGATEFMLAMGLQDKMVGTAYLGGDLAALRGGVQQHPGPRLGLPDRGPDHGHERRLYPWLVPLRLP